MMAGLVFQALECHAAACNLCILALQPKLAAELLDVRKFKKQRQWSKLTCNCIDCHDKNKSHDQLPAK